MVHCESVLHWRKSNEIGDHLVMEAQGCSWGKPRKGTVQDKLFMPISHHYRNIKWEAWHLKSWASGLYVQKLIQANKRQYESSTLLVRGIHSDQWILHTKDQLCIIYIHVMMSWKFYPKTQNRQPIASSYRWCIFLAATKQLYKWYFPSVCPSVRLSVSPSVCHTFLTMFPSSHHHEIFRSYCQWPK